MIMKENDFRACEELYATATKSLNTQIEINEKQAKRITELEAENKRLQISWVNENGLREIAYQKRVELEAENKRLIEGQQAKTEAGS